MSSINGNASNSGTSAGWPFATLQAAADMTKPGDTVVVESGTYIAETNGAALTITTSGTASAPITYQAAQGATPIIEVPAGAWAGILEYASNIIVNGFLVKGNAPNVTLSYAQSQDKNLHNPTTSADGIDVGYVGDPNTPNHVIIENNTVQNMPGGGIVATYSDYVTIHANTVTNNAYYSPFGSSGITLGFSQNVDGTIGTKNFITGNTVYGNAQLVPTASTGTITDGEGIIVDDNSNDQTNHKQYVGGTLVANNLTYSNGGPGIESYDSSNVTILFNTTYQNGQSGIDPFEVFLDRAINSTVENNIMYALPGGQTGGGSNSTGTTWDYNLLYAGGSGITGVNDRRANPLFINAGASDFKINAGSPAIGAANPAFPNAMDLAGNPLPRGAGTIGAFQYITSEPVAKPVLTASSDGTMINAPAADPIIDQAGNVWTLVQSPARWLQIAVNGGVQAATANVILLETLSGDMVQETAAGNWYSEHSPSGPWSQIAPPTIEVTNGRTNKVTVVSGTKPATTTVAGATFVLIAPGKATITLGATADKLQFIGMSAVSLTGGKATAAIVDNGGTNSFTAGQGALTITGGVGADAYIYHKGGGMISIRDFSAAKGDTLTVDQSLRTAMTQISDGHAGLIVGFGPTSPGFDLLGVTTLNAGQIHFG